MIRSTPLKIFDENAGSTQVKQGKGGGVPIKKGLQQSAAKSTRKALSSLSTSQINIRQTPASVVVPMKGKQVAMVKPVTKPKILDEFYVDDFKPDEMLCTRLSADDDYFDLQKPNVGFDLGSAHFAEPSWAQEVAALTPAGDDRRLLDEVEDEYSAYIMSLVNAPMLDLSSST